MGTKVNHWTSCRQAIFSDAVSYTEAWALSPIEGETLIKTLNRYNKIKRDGRMLVMMMESLDAPPSTSQIPTES